MHDNVVPLRSGGYLVLNQTEALVAVDVNSGKATRERNIEETALNTNMEAAEEIARQLRLRDLAGLVVIDFIDMEVNRNNARVERQLKDAMKLDRARIQIGRISPFGLLELSRQRLRPSLMETSSEVCSACGGTGHRRSVGAAALSVVRAIEEEAFKRRATAVNVYVATEVALYILNHKRSLLAEIEQTYELSISVEADDSLIPPDHRMERATEDGNFIEEVHDAESRSKANASQASRDDDGDGSRGKRRRRRGRRGRKGGDFEASGDDDNHETPNTETSDDQDNVNEDRDASANTEDDDDSDIVATRTVSLPFRFRPRIADTRDWRLLEVVVVVRFDCAWKIFVGFVLCGHGVVGTVGLLSSHRRLGKREGIRSNENCRRSCDFLRRRRCRHVFRPCPPMEDQMLKLS